MPRRIEGPPPGALRVAGRSVAVFERVSGDMRCQASVTAEDMNRLGRALASGHLATAGFGWRRHSRFGGESILRRADELQALVGHELDASFGELIPRLRARLEAEVPAGVPAGPIHGDLFRDNVLWRGEELCALLDWESAAHGSFVADLGVVFLSWCFRDTFDWACGRALCEGYASKRNLTGAEKSAFYVLLLRSAARFALTRIADFHLREAALLASGAVVKDYRRFVRRLDTLEDLGQEQVAERLWSQ